MEDTKNFRARMTKLEESVLQWEHRLQSPDAGPEDFRERVSELREALDDLGRIGFQRLAQLLPGPLCRPGAGADLSPIVFPLVQHPASS